MGSSEGVKTTGLALPNTPNFPMGCVRPAMKFPLKEGGYP